MTAAAMREPRERVIIFTDEDRRAIRSGGKTQHRVLIGEPVPEPPGMWDFLHNPRHPAPYLDAYRSKARTPENPMGKGPWWCWWTRDDRCGPQFWVGVIPGQRLHVGEDCEAIITDVRVQRLQEISEADALAEGIERLQFPERGDWGWPQARYRDLWNSIHGRGAWAANPWVAALTFKRLDPPTPRDGRARPEGAR